MAERSGPLTWRLPAVAAALAAIIVAGAGAATADPPKTCDFDDSHFHLTNYIQQGISAETFLTIMGDRVCRSTLFGIPLQQMWSYRVSGDIAPGYYLDSDAPLYYYSFTDAVIATQYLSLPPADRARFDPMITGFNPADMYAADHVRRVLATFPGVFEGIGEFTIHKEFVSPKIAGGPASLFDPALDKLLDFAGDAGLVVLIHNDISMPFVKDARVRPYFDQLKDLFLRHPKTTIIWAHLGLGRIIEPVQNHGAYLEEILSDPRLSNVYFDLSWDQVAKYLVANDETSTIAANLINKYPDRFLFGTDVVAPKSAEQYFAVYEMYQPLWAKLTPETRAKVLRGNYERLFDAARVRVRAWERANVPAAAGVQ
jgi:predicted TIM-barrel fold metal-dependent hydrolase